MGIAGRHSGRDRPRSREDLLTVLEDVITYLEMLARPAGKRAPAPLDKLALMRAENCTVHFYRYLYAAVGEPWLWFERRLIDDAALARQIAAHDTLKHMPLVMLTSLTSAASEREQHAVPVAARLSKPVRQSDLLDTILGALASRSTVENGRAGGPQDMKDAHPRAALPTATHTRRQRARLISRCENILIDGESAVAIPDQDSNRSAAIVGSSQVRNAVTVKVRHGQRFRCIAGGKGCLIAKYNAGMELGEQVSHPIVNGVAIHKVQAKSAVSGDPANGQGVDRTRNGDQLSQGIRNRTGSNDFKVGYRDAKDGLAEGRSIFGSIT